MDIYSQEPENQAVENIDMDSQQDRQEIAPCSTVSFRSVIDPSNPLGFLESAFNFASQTCDSFNKFDDNKILSLLEEIKKRKREEEEEAHIKRWRLAEEEKRKRQAEEELEEALRLELEKEKAKKLMPNKGNGLDMEKYSWTQTLEDVLICVPVPHGTQKKLVTCDIEMNKLKVGVKGQPAIIDGELFQAVKVCDSFWSLEDNETVTILLEKCKQREWWKSVVKDEPEIEIQKCKPKLKSFSYLDYESERAIKKLLFDHGQKCKGLPTSDDSAEVLKKFLADHPYFNLPRAKTT